MRKLMALVATMTLMLVAAAPAFAQDDYRNDLLPVESNYPTSVYFNNWR